jgi:hypothetical protein
MPKDEEIESLAGSKPQESLIPLQNMLEEACLTERLMSKLIVVCVD